MEANVLPAPLSAFLFISISFVDQHQQISIQQLSPELQCDGAVWRLPRGQQPRNHRFTADTVLKAPEPYAVERGPQ